MNKVEINLNIAGQGSAVDPTIDTALDAMLEQGNQLRASKLVPVLKAIVDAIPSEPGGNEPLEVEEISMMTNEQVEGLKIGDLVIDGAEDKRLYVVADVVDDVDKIKRLVNVDRRTVRTVSYTYNDDPESGEIGWGEGGGQTVYIPDSPTIEFASISDVDRLLPAGKIVKIGDAGEYPEVYTVNRSTDSAMELTSVTATAIKTVKFSVEVGAVTYIETITTTLTPDA